MGPQALVDLDPGEDQANFSLPDRVDLDRSDQLSRPSGRRARPRAEISSVVGDFDGTHACSRGFADYPHDFSTIGLDLTGINIS